MVSTHRSVVPLAMFILNGKINWNVGVFRFFWGENLLKFIRMFSSKLPVCSFWCLGRMGGMVGVQQVQVSQLQQCSLGCWLHWRPNWDRVLLFWLLLQHCVAHQNRGVSFSTILPKRHQSRLSLDPVLLLMINLRKYKCHLSWLLWQRLHLPQRLRDSQLLPVQFSAGIDVPQTVFIIVLVLNSSLWLKNPFRPPWEDVRKIDRVNDLTVLSDDGEKVLVGGIGENGRRNYGKI